MLIRRIFAELIFFVHCLVVLIVGFGWMVPNIWYVYFFTLIATLTSELTLGYCFLSKWEFDLRKRLNPSLDYEYGFSSYYTYKLTHYRLSQRFIANAATFFLVASLTINLYFKIF